ncbi:hypothetical protein JQX08_08005 [Pseudomonas sp. UL073]|uniref:Uncharacterized protein n=1 Tax=Zestomonas insulae TaxID=2809017 RepID=A0ABS2IC09_9GAMM|nr:hypothetical protein [Pseudomonas insulae]MBM7060651.1 hypothetical protein [Pseudomonas insulae]
MADDRDDAPLDDEAPEGELIEHLPDKVVENLEEVAPIPAPPPEEPEPDA